MIDTSSVEAFIHSLPKASRQIESILFLKMRIIDAISPATASLAQRGYLGCLPFAHTGADEIVLRLLPYRPLSSTPVAIAYWSCEEGMTIASNLQQFVAGRLAQMDVIGKKKLSEKDKNKLLKFSEKFGNNTSTSRVLEQLSEIQSLDSSFIRSAAVWQVADPKDKLCQTLALSRSFKGSALGNRLQETVQELTEVDIFKRIYVSYNVRNRKGFDVTAMAWQLVMSDDVFDPTYIGFTQGPSLGVWDREALIYAIQWLKNQENFEPEPDKVDLWQAVLALADDPDGYDGSLHLAAAGKLAVNDPELAYIQTANAAVYYVRATKFTPLRHIIFAHELAVNEGWKELQTVLKWTREEMEI